MELAAGGLNFPTSVALDERGGVYVAESGLAFAGAKRGGRVLKIQAGGDLDVLLEGLREPVNGLVHHEGFLYISEGGHPGRISRYELRTGTVTTLLDNLPSLGNYHTNTAAIGPDGKLYFSQGAMTNLGVVGVDAAELAWQGEITAGFDLPGYDIELAGVNLESGNPFSTGSRALTGAFSPFNSTTRKAQRIAACLPCTSAVMRCALDGSNLELVAWGLRNAYGLGFLPDGRLLATDQAADDRGSRGITNAPDLLFEVRPGCWYGFPDFVGGDPVSHPRFTPKRGPAPTFVLSNHAELPQPERALLEFEPNAAAVKFDVIRSGPWQGQLIVALFGDEKPMTAVAGQRVGRKLIRVDLERKLQHVFETEALERPIDVKFAPDGALYVVDFGAFEMNARKKAEARPGSGKLWKIAKP